MDFNRYFSKAWKLTISNIVSLILLTLVMTILSFLTLGILAPVMLAGYMQAILLMVRQGREPVVGDLFSQMRLFLPLFIFGLVCFFLVFIGLILIVVPGLIIGLAITYYCLYLIPLMTDRRLGLMDAIKQSIAMARQVSFGEHLVLVIIFLGISALGGAVMFGTLFTQPLATVILLLAYNDRVQAGTSGSAGQAPPPPPPPA
ncbi:MAG: hypothetical protein PVG03_02495 [Desulfarculaceae bacterium]|jgi:hypothetical protein